MLPWLHQRAANPGLARATSMARGLFNHLWAFRDSSVPRDLLGQCHINQVTRASDYEFRGVGEMRGPFGASGLGTAAARGFSSSNAIALTGHTSACILAVVTFQSSSSSAESAIIRATVDATSQGYALDYFSSTGTLRPLLATSGTNGWTAGNDRSISSLVAPGATLVIAFHWNGSVGGIYASRLGQPLALIGSTFSITGTTTALAGYPYIGGMSYAGGTTDPFPGIIHLVGVSLSKRIGAEHLKLLGVDPFGTLLESPVANMPLLNGGDAFSKAMAESFILSDVSDPASQSFTPLQQPLRLLSAPAGRRISAAWYAGNEDRSWAYSGTLANVSTAYHPAEGRVRSFLSSVCASYLMPFPIGWDNTMNFTILTRLRLNAGVATQLFAFGHTANGLQHQLYSTGTSTLYFVAAGWNGSTNTIYASGETGALDPNRFYNIAITVRYQLIEIWIDGVKVVSSATTLTFAAHAMTHAVLHGVMSGGSPSGTASSVTFAALVALTGQVMSDAEIRGVSSHPRGIHRLFEQRQAPLLLTAGGSTLNSVSAESFTLTHAQTGAHAMVSAGAESIIATDAQSGAVAGLSAAAESLTPSDAQSGAVAGLSAAAESLTPTDTPAGALGGAAGAAEALTLTHAQTGAHAMVSAAAESFTLTDALGVALAAISALSETLTLLDDANAATPGLGVMMESVTLADSQGNVAALRVAAAESVNLTEAVASLTNQLKAAAESLTLADGSTGDVTVAYAKSLVEALSLAHTNTGVLIGVSTGSTETVYVLAELTTMVVERDEARMVVPTVG